MMTGPQPVSVYIVHVVPLIGAGGVVVQTLSTTPSDTPTKVTPTIVARSIPTKSGMLPVDAIGALALVLILGFSRQE